MSIGVEELPEKSRWRRPHLRERCARDEVAGNCSWICGYPFVAYRHELALVAVPVWKGRPLYQSYLICRSDLKAGRLPDLAGTVQAFSDPDCLRLGRSQADRSSKIGRPATTAGGLSGNPRKHRRASRSPPDSSISLGRQSPRFARDAAASAVLGNHLPQVRLTRLQTADCRRNGAGRGLGGDRSTILEAEPLLVRIPEAMHVAHGRAARAGYGIPGEGDRRADVGLVVHGDNQAGDNFERLALGLLARLVGLGESWLCRRHHVLNAARPQGLARDFAAMFFGHALGQHFPQGPDGWLSPRFRRQ